MSWNPYAYRSFLRDRTRLRSFSLVLALAMTTMDSPHANAADTPILFVHGNGDTAALWITTLWRFESNGYDAKALFAIDMPHPSAPASDSQEEVNRSTTLDQRETLGKEVESILLATGAAKLVLIGSSRGGNAIRDYVSFGGGHRKVSIAILCGTPNHGVVARPSGLDNEFNGMGPFLERLNHVDGGSEVHPDVSFVTLRSDTNDKYAQPTGEVLGFPGEPTGVSYDGPELRGAKNVVLPGLDHREVAFHERAFRELYLAVTGREPASVAIEPETTPVLDGMVSGYENDAATNLPVAGARVEIYEVDPDSGVRQGPVRHQAVTSADGRWGPFEASATATYEFVLAAEGYPTLHTYRSPFPRSSRYVHLRLAPLSAFLGDKAEECSGSAVQMTRPRGYFGRGRDQFTLGGQVPDEIAEGVPSTSAALRCFDNEPRSVPAVLNDETIVVRTYPLTEEHISIAEFHY